ncbi:unnamed protein product [Sphenostylis stenocarpa]|uniref:NAD-dependent epimerase/dehydratase domain-containing protein n=1 Tax=Sphenostylis stenocarpa TaxID=92480 RepID=A0AA86SC22_9FABA|nr:unnamed protein product [Sphenostylis stenocarpa]
MAANTVCVTGAGGFVASWLVKLLLSKGFFVHGTVRQPGSEKYQHLLKLEGASENLTLFKADLLDYDSVLSAFVGCTAVFHVACPVFVDFRYKDLGVEMIEPAVKGTANVLEACLEAKVQRVVFVSSLAAICMDPNLPKDKVIDESYWSDKDYCRRTENWYCYSKTEAEKQALDFAKRTGLDVVSICPSLVLGPILQSATVNASSLVVLKLLKGAYYFLNKLLTNSEFGLRNLVDPGVMSNQHNYALHGSSALCGDSFENKTRWIVDVRDLVDAIFLVYEKHEAERRYLCNSHTVNTRDLVEKLKSIYPSYKYPSNFTEVDNYLRLCSEKLERLGWKYRSLEETLIDSVGSYGFLQSQ